MPARGPLVSVCIPACDGMPHIEECLESVLAQTFGDFELLIVDDASTDATLDLVARRLLREPRLRLYRNAENLGLVGNWNRCVELARGKWVKFVFQDDFLKPACLARLLDHQRPGVPLIACKRSLRFEGVVPEGVRRMYRRHLAVFNLGRRFPGRRFIRAEEFAGLVSRHPALNFIGEPTAVMFRRAAFERFGPFNADLINLCDWEFFSRVAVHSGLCYVDEPLATFRVHARAASWRNRVSRLYRTEFIDELIIRHELAHAPVYEPVRRAARLGSPRVDLAESLAVAARRCRAMAGRFRRTAGPDGNALAVWSDTLRRYPRLRDIPLRPRPADRRHLRIARELWRGSTRGLQAPC